MGRADGTAVAAPGTLSSRAVRAARAGRAASGTRGPRASRPGQVREPGRVSGPGWAGQGGPARQCETRGGARAGEQARVPGRNRARRARRVRVGGLGWAVAWLLRRRGPHPAPGPRRAARHPSLADQAHDGCPAWASCRARLPGDGLEHRVREQFGDPVPAHRAAGDRRAELGQRPDGTGQAGQVGEEHQQAAQGQPAGAHLDGPGHQRAAHREARQQVGRRAEPGAGVQGRHLRRGGGGAHPVVMRGLSVGPPEDVDGGNARQHVGGERGQLAGALPGLPLRTVQGPVAPPCHQRVERHHAQHDEGQPPVHQGGDDDHPGQQRRVGQQRVRDGHDRVRDTDRVRADPVQQLTGGVPGGVPRRDAEQVGDQAGAEPDGHPLRGHPGQERDQVAGDRAQRQQQQARCRGGHSQDGRAEPARPGQPGRIRPAGEPVIDDQHQRPGRGERERRVPQHQPHRQGDHPAVWPEQLARQQRPAPGQRERLARPSARHQVTWHRAARQPPPDGEPGGE